MSRVMEILNSPSVQFHCVSPETPVWEAVQLFSQAELGAILVKDNDQVVGIFSERDYTRKVAAKNLSNETPIHKVMSSPVYYVSPEESAEDCLALMNQKKVRHLPVIDQGRVVGMVSVLDVVQTLLLERDTVIDHLERYVSETWPF